MLVQANRIFTAWHRCGWGRGGLDDARDFIDCAKRPAFRSYVDGWSNAHFGDLVRAR